MDAYYEFSHDTANLLLLEWQVNPISPPHFHSCYEILYITSGAVDVSVGSRNARLTAGDLYVAESYTIHSDKTNGQSHGILLIVPESMIRPYLENAGGRAFRSPFLLSSDGSEEIRHCLETMFRLKDGGQMESLTVQGYVYVIFGLLTQYIGLSPELPGEIKMLPKDVLVYMQEHFAAPLSLNETAGQFGYSPVYFSRFFRKYFGCGFHEYLNLLRLRNAVSLVTQKGRTFASAALESGFENQRTFNRAFQKAYRSTPSLFVKDIKRQNTNSRLRK